jgi:hypothetical protein
MFLNPNTHVSGRPAGVTATAILFFVAAGYLVLLGGVMLLSPGTISMTMGAPLLSGLELAGPYMFFLVGAAGAVIGYGLLKLNNWARRLAIVAALLGAFMLIPSVSAAAVDFRPALLWTGSGLMIRVIIVWYLYQSPVIESFQKHSE